MSVLSLRECAASDRRSARCRTISVAAQLEGPRHAARVGRVDWRAICDSSSTCPEASLLNSFGEGLNHSRGMNYETRLLQITPHPCAPRSARSRRASVGNSLSRYEFIAAIFAARACAAGRALADLVDGVHGIHSRHHLGKRSKVAVQHLTVSEVEEELRGARLFRRGARARE